MVLLKTHKACILFLQNAFRVFWLLLFFGYSGFSQEIKREFFQDSTYIKSDSVFINKQISFEFEKAIHLALQFYPELYQTKIKFKFKRAKSPLSARPNIWGVFRIPSKRKYIITISSSTAVRLKPISLKNLRFNSQIGVIGHELSHISFYQSKRGIYFIKLVLMHFRKKAIDRFEFDTDKRCIEHGLGFQLLSWSIEVRANLNIKQWGGAGNQENKRERYMNPNTISGYIKTLPIYTDSIK